MSFQGCGRILYARVDRDTAVGRACQVESRTGKPYPCHRKLPVQRRAETRTHGELGECHELGSVRVEQLEIEDANRGRRRIHANSARPTVRGRVGHQLREGRFNTRRQIGKGDGARLNCQARAAVPAAVSATALIRRPGPEAFPHAPASHLSRPERCEMLSSKSGTQLAANTAAVVRRGFTRLCSSGGFPKRGQSRHLKSEIAHDRH